MHVQWCGKCNMTTFSALLQSILSSVLTLRKPYGHTFISLSLSISTAIFQVNLGQPVFIEAKDDGGGGDNWTTISRAKLQSNHHHQQTNIHFFYRLDARSVTQPKVSKH